MQQRPENLKAGEDPETTLVTPRFDANDARRAHPVVPLAEAPPRTPYTNAHAPRVRRARAPRRSWTTALLAVALLAVAAVGGALATKGLQRPSAEQGQEQTPSAPAQALEAPPTQPEAPQAVETPREETTAAKPSTRDTRTRRTRNADTLVAIEPAREDAEADEDHERGKKAEKRREHEDDTEKETRRTLKRAKKNAPRLVDVLTPSP